MSNRCRWYCWSLLGLLLGGWLGLPMARASAPRAADRSVTCEILIVGGGLAGTAAAYEGLLAGRTVCLTDITDWIGGQLSSQGTTALDEARRQRQLLFYARGYQELRDRIREHYGELNPGDCWVSATCFLPADAHNLLSDMLMAAAERGNGDLKWFPHTVVKDLSLGADGRQIEAVTAIRHQPAPGTPALNNQPLSHILADAYHYQGSARLSKEIIQFVPLPPEAEPSEKPSTAPPADWYVIEATETGELVALAQVPYRLGLDPRSPLNPSSPVETQDPYCTQGFTYTFAMEQLAEPQIQVMPPFYPQYASYYSYERAREGYSAQDYFDFVFTYRRIWSPPVPEDTGTIIGVARPHVGDVSMQNWTWGNDYRPGTAQDNLIYTQAQLEQRGQLEPGGMVGGLRPGDPASGEKRECLGFYYWLVAGNTDSQLDDSVKIPHPNHRFLAGFDTPMGTAHGLSKYPYIREGRRIIGRPAYGYPQGFAVHEVDFSWQDFRGEYYQTQLDPRTYLRLWRNLAGLATTRVIEQGTPAEEIPRRMRSRIYPDAVGIAQYAIDFHPCMAQHPPEAPGNIERPGVRQAHGQAYPAQIPLRTMIPQEIDNLLVAGKSIATSTIAAAAYRVHSFEWSAGAAAGTTVDFALDQGLLPYQLVDDLPQSEPQLEQLRWRLEGQGNPTAFPGTSIFNEAWQDWRPW
ncbi:uncharacterized protein XM38_029300 [Halomicronema hongdechloris C2206]|uniref:FAD-dependent oxidoreductase n=1 Tax=Halomicronema hongdechloris C2206 TaxID=1641165 RepID=A0A1Z3HNW4_9CYAN|nr:FAD-dependent oxidoreductase [Halomicronema hongdechloris]ASC71976.1 uncharacterized protein XM38_029300 [Halomicronema hongdechloris C2206]